MGLHCNGYRLGYSPFKMRGGALISIYTPVRQPSALGHAGTVRGIQYNLGTLAALPHGNNYPSAWMIPQKAGGMSSHNRCSMTISGSGAGALGRGMVGSSGVSISGSAIGGLIAGGVGNATISISGSGSIVATTGSTGSASISIGGVATPGALAWLQGQADIDITGALVSYAIGHMAGTTEEAGLSASGIAKAVWTKILESGFSAEEILRLLAAHAAGDATGLESGSMALKSLDGTKTRVAATYTAGNRSITSRDVT